MAGEAGQSTNVILRFQGEDDISPVVQRIRSEILRINEVLGVIGGGFDRARDKASTIADSFSGITDKVTGAKEGVSELNGELSQTSNKITTMTTKMSEFDRMVNEAQAHSLSLGGNFETAGTKIEEDNSKLESMRLVMGSIASLAGAIGIGFVSDSVNRASENASNWRRIYGTEGVQEHTPISKYQESWLKNSSSYWGVDEEASLSTLQSAMVRNKGNWDLSSNEIKTAQMMAIAKGGSVSEMDSAIQSAMYGRPKALEKLTGLNADDIKKAGNDPNKLFSLIQNAKGIKGASQEGRESDEAKFERAKDAMHRLSEDIGIALLPSVEKLCGGIEWLSSQFEKLPKGVQNLIAFGGAALAVISFLALPFKIITSFFNGIKSAMGTIGDKTGITNKLKGVKDDIPPVNEKLSQFADKIRDVGKACDEADGTGSLRSDNSRTGKTGKEGKEAEKDVEREEKEAEHGGLRSFFKDDRGSLGAGGRIGKKGEKAGSILSKIGGFGSKALRFAGPLGALLDVGFTAQGAYDGWNDTKGNTGDKAKGAVGGAVESATFGLIPRDSVVKGINFAQSKIGGFQKWAGKGWKDMSKTAGKNLGNLGKTVEKPFQQAYTGVTRRTSQFKAQIGSFLRKVPDEAKGELSTVEKIISTPFIEGFNTAKSWTLNGTNFIRTTVQKGVSDVENDFSQLPGKVGGYMQSMVNQIENWTNQGISWLKKLYCMVVGCSPGVIPAFKRMSNEVPILLNRTAPHIRDFSKLVNAPDLKMKGSQFSGSGKVEYHTHYHTNTFDMSHIDRKELASALIDVYEGRGDSNVKINTSPN